MNNKTYNTLPKHLPLGELAFHSATSELFVGMGDEKPLRKVSDLEIQQLLKNSNVDYLGNKHSTIRDVMNSNVDYLLGEVNTLNYTGQHITAENSIQGQCKSAILMGNTLMNCITKYINKEVTFTNSPLKRSVNIAETSNTTLQPSKDYLYVIKVTDLNLDGLQSLQISLSSSFNGVFMSDNNFQVRRNGVYKIKARTAPVLTDTKVVLKGEAIHFEQTVSTTRAITISDIMIIEYQDGMENWDIPYFEGMQSSKMPVLTTTGKNLYEDTGGKTNWTIDGYTGKEGTGSRFVPNSYTKVCPNTSYTLYRSVTAANIGVRYYDSNRDYIVTTDLPPYTGMSSLTFTTPINCHYVKWIDEANNPTNKYQIEQGSTATPYEPHKSNILSCLEDVELSSVGDVRDTLNWLTGEVVNNFKKMIIDGSELWQQGGSQSDGFIRFYTQAPQKHFYGKVFSPNIQSCNDNVMYGNVGYENISGYSANSMINLSLKVERLGVTDLGNSNDNISKLKQWLTTNNIEFQYQLQEKAIKTVVLSDNTVYSHNGTTHYSCSSEEGSLVPTLSVDVPTKIQEVVARQRDEIQKLTVENSELKNGQILLETGHESQEEEIITTQDAVNFLLFDLNTFSTTKLNSEKEIDKMALYIANQILKGKVPYEKAVKCYPQFKEDIDSILIFEGREDLVQI